MNLANLTKGASLNSILRMFSYGPHPKPQRDWLIVMCSALILLLASVGWSYYVFKKISTPVQSAAQAQTPKATASNVDLVRALFEQRAAEREHYLTDYRFVDPSL